MSNSEERDCERCGEFVPLGYNATPSGNLFCEDCISFDDVFPDEDESEDSE